MQRVKLMYHATHRTVRTNPQTTFAREDGFFRHWYVLRTFGTHGIRHGFISLLVNNGGSSDQIVCHVGHSS